MILSSPLQRIWHRWQGLSWHERWFLVKISLALPCIWLAVRILSFDRLAGILGKTRRSVGRKAGPGDETEEALIERIVSAVSRAARFSPFRPQCFERSLMIWWLLRREGVSCDVRLGVRRAGGNVEAHAWVERDGASITGGSQTGDAYRSFPIAITPN